MTHRMRRALIALLWWAPMAACGASRVHRLDRELLDAATVGDTGRIEAALAQGADSNATAEHGWTALMFAARSGDVAGVASLLKHGAKVNSTNDLGQTALMVCHANVVRLLVHGGAAVDARDFRGATALMMTSDVDKTHALLAAGSSVGAEGQFAASALMSAALRGETERLQVLIDAGADVNADRAGRTALMDAAYQGNADTVRLLVKHGADVHRRDLDGDTALHFAARNLRRGVVEAVLAANPDVNSRSNDGNTPLLLAVRDGYTENVRALLAGGADPQIGNDATQSALSWALARNQPEIVALLRAAGAHDDGEPARDLDELKRAARASAGGTLIVFTTDVLTDGRVAKVRGRVQNTYGERVQGIRYVVSLFGRDSLLLDTLQYETDTAIDSGKDAVLRMDIESMYLAAEGRMLIQAFPKQVGTRYVPRPPGWVEH